MWIRHSARNRRNPAQTPAQQPPFKWRRAAKSAAGFAAVAAAAGLCAAALNRPIETVSMSGRFERVSPLEVERAVKASVHGAGLLSVSLGAVRASVGRLPWVDTVSVARSWPRGLAVRIVEQVPVARWDGGGLINARGDRFESEASRIPPGLPLLGGPQGSETKVAQRYFAMQPRLTEAGLTMTALRLNPRGAWQFELADGVTVRLGRKRIDARFQTFLTVAAKIVVERASDIAYVDMRYMNGFAIGWRAGGAARRAPGEDS